MNNPAQPPQAGSAKINDPSGESGTGSVAEPEQGLLSGDLPVGVCGDGDAGEPAGDGYEPV